MVESLLREVNEISGRLRIPNKLCHVNFGASGKLGLVVLRVNVYVTAVSSVGAAPPTTQAHSVLMGIVGRHPSGSTFCKASGCGAWGGGVNCENITLSWLCGKGAR